VPARDRGEIHLAKRTLPPNNNDWGYGNRFVVLPDNTIRAKYRHIAACANCVGQTLAILELANLAKSDLAPIRRALVHPTIPSSSFIPF
jgi:hypothetical protein